MVAKEQNRLVGIFLLIHGALQTIMMFVIVLIYAGIGTAMFASARRNEEQIVGLAFVAMMVFVFIFSLLFVIPQLVGGWKMLKERPNARTWGIIGSIVACMSFPLGTAAGVFGLIFLFGESGRQFYLGSGNSPNYYPPPPPPNNWR